MALELSLDLISPPSRAVYMFATKNKLQTSKIQFKWISLLKGEQHSEEFGKVNPFKKVPALKDGDFSMAESIPMMEYMAEKFKTDDHWFPKDLRKRARVHQYLSWHPLGIQLPSTNLFRIKFMAPIVFKQVVPESKITAAREDLNSALDQIEKLFIQDRGFIGGEQISIADLVAIAEIMQPVAAGVDVFEGRPRLTAWKERVVQAVGKALFDEAHKNVLVDIHQLIEKLDDNLLQAALPRVLMWIK